MVGRIPLKDVILVRIQVRQQSCETDRVSKVAIFSNAY